jgi:hypothetical protein
MKKFIIISLLLCAWYSHAQQLVSTNSIPVSKNIDVLEWQVYVETAEFKIEYRKSDCYPNSGLDFQSILLRYTNLTGGSISLSWHIDLDYDGSCKTCGLDEYDRTMTLEPNEVKEGNCIDKSNYKLDLFSKFIDPAYMNGAELTQFKLSSLTLL